MADQKDRSLIDELSDRIGDVVDSLERLLQPKQEPARSPVPVRNNGPQLPRRRRRR
jgi:hypothetical protein